MKRLFFDIETTANPEACALMAEPKAPGNLKDPDKIRLAIEEKRAEQIESAALDPDYGKVLSIGWAIDNGPVLVEYVGTHQGMQAMGELVDFHYSECDLISEFWQIFQSCNGNCVGYNILNFDLPYLMRRSMALGFAFRCCPA
jgi:DNA polymerase elongation subunit (family B)